MIYIKERVYKEMVWVPFEKMNLVFIRDNMGKMITKCSLNVDTVNVSTYNMATVDEYNLTFLSVTTYSFLYATNKNSP